MIGLALGGSAPSERRIYYASRDVVARQRFSIDTIATIRFGTLHSVANNLRIPAPHSVHSNNRIRWHNNIIIAGNKR